MRPIDMESWPRRHHFEIYRAFGYPHFSLCANLDISRFYPAVRARQTSFTATMMYVIARAANAIPEFRYRIRGEAVVEHERVDPSGTILTAENVFSFCTVAYSEDFPTFIARAAAEIESVKENPTVWDEPGRDDLLFMTSIPWVSFTSFMHPIDLNPADSVPRFAWGKFFREGERLLMPLSVQGHHALMDGLHMGRYYETVQRFLQEPDFLPEADPAPGARGRAGER